MVLRPSSSGAMGVVGVVVHVGKMRNVDNSSAGKIQRERERGRKIK